MPLLPAGERLYLQADGLDYAGYILVDGQIAAEFAGMLIPHQFDLTEVLSAGEHRLSIIFTEPPHGAGADRLYLTLALFQVTL